LNTGRIHSIFTSALSRNEDAEWHFQQEKATFENLKMEANEVKML
jgi:hypothetical protein